MNQLHGVTVYDVPADKFINDFAIFLEKSGSFALAKVTLSLIHRFSGLTLSRLDCIRNSPLMMLIGSL